MVGRLHFRLHAVSANSQHCTQLAVLHTQLDAALAAPHASSFRWLGGLKTYPCCLVVWIVEKSVWIVKALKESPHQPRSSKSGAVSFDAPTSSANLADSRSPHS